MAGRHRDCVVSHKPKRVKLRDTNRISSTKRRQLTTHLQEPKMN